MLPRVFSPLFVATFFIQALFAQSSPAPPSGPSITATFWNVQWFPGRRPNASRWEEDRQIRSVHRDIAQVNSDLVAFEEVRNFEQAAVAVKPLPGFKVDVCSNFPAREGQVETQQVAITSRLQPLAAWAESWKPRSAITPPRGFAFAAYEMAPRQILLVYALHLKSNRGEIHEDMRIREESMNQLLAHTQAMKATYEKLGSLTWIIGGDFNTAPDDPRFIREKTVPALLAQDFRWAWDGVPFRSRITVPADERYPAASFDQIFYRAGALMKAWLVGTSPQSSDHRAVSVMLSLK
jgi:endonuclease/exonuclease/phosphatase family metal-dependent hydrolase